MCARRFLLAVFVLTLLACAGAFAVFQYGGEVLRTQIKPQGHFQAPAPRTGPDYALDENWIAKPGLAEDPSVWRPRDFAEDAARGTAAVFYIHPTTYLRKDRWNALLGDGESRQRAALFVRSQASAFNAAGEVWAPRYRQAAFGAFLLQGHDADQALELAYHDVAGAFERFVASVEPGQPIILAGHSQGALHLSRLLREKVAGRPIARRIAAAYVVGWPLSLTADVPAMGLPACRTADQAGCILSWQSFKEPANTSLITDVYVGSKGPNGAERRREDMLCTNPVSGIMDGAAPARANAGALEPVDGELNDASLAVGRVSARCDNGFLMIDGEIPELGPYVLPGNNYHVYDYALFWGSTRQDAARRLASWRP
ncbi:DUF3089 domain-containing protein [Sphingomonas sp. GCM10030256]|uniref:DUF3089 domain-containing protein n=1 Tax=Sphingomonas sp. GCM10030256 TaxID=3273427 RepID=UPI003623612D